MSRDTSSIPNPLSEEVRVDSAATTSPGDASVSGSVPPELDSKREVSYLLIE